MSDDKGFVIAEEHDGKVINVFKDGCQTDNKEWTFENGKLVVRKEAWILNITTEMGEGFVK